MPAMIEWEEKQNEVLVRELQQEVRHAFAQVLQRLLQVTHMGSSNTEEQTGILDAYVEMMQLHSVLQGIQEDQKDVNSPLNEPGVKSMFRSLLTLAAITAPENETIQDIQQQFFEWDRLE